LANSRFDFDCCCLLDKQKGILMTMMTMMSGGSIGRNGDSDQSLWRWSQWLSNISERDAELLKQGPEYDRFLVAMERLEEAHIAILNSTNTHHPIETTNSIIIAGQPRLFSLQNSLLFRIFDFLECRDLVNSAKCCHRFNFLSREMARLRTRDMLGEQQLPSRMQLLRAREQIEGIATTASYRTVPIPVLLPPRRILVTHCGDDDCNGIYICTAANGNGFEFTKHRFTDAAGRLVGNDVRPDFERRLRCRIGKRFSGQVCACGSLVVSFLLCTYASVVVAYYRTFSCPLHARPFCGI
jgi:hypothetical protein